MTTPQPNENLSYIQWKAWSPEAFGIVTAEEDTQFACEIRRAGIDLTQGSQVLEIGFGNGASAAWVRRHTAHYVGSESNPQLITRARQAGIEAYPATLDLASLAQGRSFDLIAIFDVLEHLEVKEILELLESSRRCLSANGRLVIRVPSGDSPFSGPFMHGDITHKTYLGTLAFHQLAGLSGLEVVAVRNAAFPIFGFGAMAALIRIAVAAARKIISSLIRIVYYGNRPAAISPNLIAVLRLGKTHDKTTAEPST
ncbi:MAG: methyltransferase [Rhodanobacter sp.]|nr:MAG: methyltransferase [Rhodanobacter sp.]TAM41382.1 MAG: methyltransferase [Rhodanobacter sp.]TAN26520.1 MAG: methyltransferase [Rhodanobacter sp.]